MTQINSFRDLLVWQKAMDLAVRCYGVSRRMPRDEQPVLGYQIRKCAVSIPSNIAEGKSRGRMLRGLVASLERSARA
jgi:four helix bundle protein